MQAYLLNKGVSILLPVMAIYVTFSVMGSTQSQWTLLLMIVFTLGYTHYFIGGYYQIRGFLRHAQSFRLIGFFIGCVIISALLISVAQLYGCMWLVAFLAIPYFMLHGYFNEITLFEKGSTSAVPSSLFLSISLFLTGLTMLAFAHPSAYFGYDLSFVSPLVYTVEQSIQTSVGQFGDIVAIFLLCGGVLVTLAALFARYQYARAYQALLVLELGSLGLLMFGRPNYTYFFFLLLSYHFLTWAIFYGQQFYQRSTISFMWYVIFHLAIIAAALAGYWLFVQSGVENPTAIVFNGNVFLFLTMVHITSSFLNDAWCKRLLGIL